MITGDPLVLQEKGLTVSWAQGKEPAILSDLLTATNSTPANSTAETPTTQSQSAATNNISDFESLTYMRMRQAKERKRLRELATTEK